MLGTCLCGSKQFTVVTEEERFPYGIAPDTVMLSAQVKVQRCTRCGFECTDSAAEYERHGAVMAHKAVLADRKRVVELLRSQASASAPVRAFHFRAAADMIEMFAAAQLASFKREADEARAKYKD